MNTIEQNNELIRVFMGDKINSGAISIGKETSFYMCPPSYNSDWNLLMRVVDLIETKTEEDGRGDVEYVVTIDSGYCVISHGGEEVIAEAQVFESGKTKIRLVWEAVIGFINYYNSLNQSKQSNE